MSDHSHYSNLHWHIGSAPGNEKYNYYPHITADIRNVTLKVNDTLVYDNGYLMCLQDPRVLEVAAKYPNLSPEGKQKLHERMAEFSRLTPEQKKTARENFRRAYEVPAEQRQATIQKYQELPPDKKRELADRAAAKPEAPRRPATREHDVPPARPPAKTGPQAK